MPKTFLTTSLMVLSLAATAQINLKGKIIDLETSDPVVGAHIYALNAGTYSNHLGEFELIVQTGDSVFVSHVAYENQIFQPKTDRIHLIVQLKKEDQILDPFIVHLLPALEQFKQEIINSRIFDRDQENAMLNMARIKQQFLNGYIPEMNAMDNYKEYIKGPKGVTLFSTQSNKGLVGALKNGTNYSLERGESAFNNNDFGQFFPFTKSRLDSTRRLNGDSI